MSCAAAGAEPDCHAPDKQPDADRLEQIRELMDDLAEIESASSDAQEPDRQGAGSWAAECRVQRATRSLLPS